MTGTIVAAALVFGCLAWFGIVLSARVCARLPRLSYGPPAAQPPVPYLIAGSALFGAALALHQVPFFQLLLLGVVWMALVAAWCSDSTMGIVPDVFTLVPLAFVIAVAVFTHAWWIVASALIPLLPFGLAALASRGRGMGWGDVKLVALGGALLGIQTAIAAFAVACIAAALVYRLRGTQTGPIAFAPYLVAAIGISLALIG